MQASHLKRAVCMIGLHGWDLIHVGTPWRPYFLEQCRNCGTMRSERWRTR